MRKILLYFSLIAANFAFASEIEISLLEYKSNSFVYNIPAVLDEESKINLPFLIYSLGKDIESVSVDSFFFSEGIIAGDFDVKIFSGNVPLSMPSVSKSDSRPDNVSAGIISDEGVKTLKIFPFTYDGRTLKYHKSLKLFYTADYMRSDDPKAEPEYDCLIVCHADYDTAFERLKKWKEQRGLKTRIITTDSIFAYYSGADSAEKLRNFIKSEHALFDFTYLILGGDRATIPVRRMYAMNCNADYYDDEDSIPADIYYSALEGDFDFDNDGIYGEISDSADLTQEILVGRILFDTIYYGPSPIITRIIDYEQTKNTEQLNRGMFMGMILWNPPFTPGGEAKEMIYNDIIPTSFHVLKFYEHWGHSGKADILDSLDNGYGIVNHNGHGSFKGIWVDTLTSLSRGDMTGLTNFSKTGLFYSIGCWVGAFDRDNTTYNLHSITQNMQNSPTGGYISIITNSRYGWGAPGYPGLGVSDVFDYRFFDMLFNSEEKRPAALLRDLKEEFSPLSDNENLYRWHQYQLNYFGDPSTMIYTGNPEVLNVSIKKSDSTLLISILKSNGFPAEKADVCIYRDSIIERGVTNAGGYFSADIGSFADSTVIITVTGAMLSTFIDTVDLGHAMESEIIISSDSIHSGAQNSIRLINPSFTAIDADLLSDFIDTSISISAGETIYVDYAPVYSASRTDTITWTIAGGGASGEVVVNVKPTLLKFDSLYFESTVFNAKLLFNHTKMLKDCIVRIVLSGTDTLLDTAISGSFIGEAKIIEATGIPAGLDYLTAEAYLFKQDTLLSKTTSFINNGEVSFHDEFNSDFSRWEYKTQNWALNSKEQLYCGNPGSYLNDMDDTIVSHDFYIYPGSVCSIYIEAYLPSLEFIGSEPVFDLDGLFIKRIDQDKDTVLLEFISSGGALKSVQSMKIEGWREYVFNESAPVKSKIFLNFISDSVITDSGVFIESIKVKPQFYYAESTYITRDDKNIIGKDIVKYALSGVTGQITAEIISIDGRIIKRYNFNETASASLSFENLPSGVYFVLFRAGRMAFKDKLIILK